MRVFLIRGPRQQVKLRLDGSFFVVGRGEPLAVFQDDPSISREHAVIVDAPEGVKVKDLGSSNGVVLNGRRLARYAEAPLAPGDTFVVGNTRLKLLTAAEVQALEARKAAAREAASGEEAAAEAAALEAVALPALPPAGAASEEGPDDGGDEGSDDAGERTLSLDAPEEALPGPAPAAGEVDEDLLRTHDDGEEGDDLGADDLPDLDADDLDADDLEDLDADEIAHELRELRLPPDEPDGPPAPAPGRRTELSAEAGDSFRELTTLREVEAVADGGEGQRLPARDAPDAEAPAPLVE